MVDHTIVKSVIRTTERMTYEDCNRRCPTATLPWRSGTPGYFPSGGDMATPVRVLEGRRRRRALELDTRESYVVCDESGTPVGRGAPHAGDQLGPRVPSALARSFHAPSI